MIAGFPPNFPTRKRMSASTFRSTINATVMLGAVGLSALIGLSGCINGKLTPTAATVLQDVADLGCEVAGGAVTIFTTSAADGGVVGTVCEDLADKAIQADTAVVSGRIGFVHRVGAGYRVRVVQVPLASCKASEMVSLPARTGAHGEMACPSLVARLKSAGAVQ